MVLASICNRSKSLVSALAVAIMAAAVIFCSNSSRALQIDSISPSMGEMAGGSAVTIRGSGFTVKESEKFADIAAGVEHAVMLSVSGHVWTVGRNTYGQLGIGGNSKYQTTPQDITKSFQLNNNDRIIQVFSGDYYSFAVSQQHRIFAWGLNDKGQIGDGTMINRVTPVEITNNFKFANPDDYVTAIYPGVATTFALTNFGSTYMWGDARERQDGYNSESYVSKLLPIDATSWLTENNRLMAVGNKSYAAINTRQQFHIWGRNADGELMLAPSGQPNSTISPVFSWDVHKNLPLTDGDEITSIDAGNGVMAATTKYCRVYIWGTNAQNMLGVGSDQPNPHDDKTGNILSSAPIDITDRFQLADDDCISTVSVGNSHVVAVSQYGQVFSWGDGRYGQLGQGNITTQPEITNITHQFALADGVNIEKVIAAGSADNQVASYSYALDSLGNVYAWGGSAKGLPGINILNNKNVPNIISNRLSAEISNVSSINFGDYEADVFNVISDNTIKLLTPGADTPGKVKLSMMDKTGALVSSEVEYEYINNADATDDGGEDGSGDNSADDSSGDNQADDLTDDGSANGGDRADLDGTDKSDSSNGDGTDGSEGDKSSGKKSSTKSTKKSSVKSDGDSTDKSTASGSVWSKIGVPNTGY